MSGIPCPQPCAALIRRRAAAFLCCACLLAAWGLALAPLCHARGYAVQISTAQASNSFTALRQQVRDMGLPEYVIASYTDGVHFFVHAGVFESVEALLAAQAMVEDTLKMETALVYDHTTDIVPVAELTALRDAQAKALAVATAPAAAPAPQTVAAPKAAAADELFSVQVSSAATLEQARTVQAAFRAKGFDATVILLYDGQHVPWQVVQLGAFGSFAEARALADQLAGSGAKSIIHRLAASLIRERTQAQ